VKSNAIHSAFRASIRSLLQKHALTLAPALLFTVVCAAPSFAGDDGVAACLENKTSAAAEKKAAGFDPGSGRDIRNYPPHRIVDFRHMKLEVTIPDMNVPKLSATQTLTVHPISGPVDSLALDAREMKIDSVVALGHETRFGYDNRTLNISFAPPIGEDETVDIITSYKIEDPPLGMIWTPESPAWPGRAAQIHTQGQPETNSFWFPCHDFPNAKMTTELVATVPAGYTVSSNGHLLEQRHEIFAQDTTSGVRMLRPFDKFHWVQDKPHVSYLVTMVVGKFDVVDVGTKKLSMPVYAPQGRSKDVPATFGRTKDMIALFEQVTGQAYPWDRYAQLLVWNFGSGGMENTSATTLYDTCIADPSSAADHDMDGLISHELAHQWFGDFITCNSWEHIWLNEGFATYMTALWMEHKGGADAYQKQILDYFDAITGGDQADAPYTVGMCSKVYSHPWEVFRKAASPYSKGASILHMLRMNLGDDDFFKGIRLYVQRRGLQTAESSDFRTALEDVSGRNLEQFFWQWCERPGTPHLTIKPEWDAPKSTLNVTINQTQHIDGDNPAYEFALPILLGGLSEAASKGEKATARIENIAVSGQTTTWSLKLDKAPTFVAVDPSMSVLAALEESQSLTQWTAQLNEGPTVYTRVQACRGLKSEPSSGAAEILRRAASDRKQALTVRVEAIKALGGRGAAAELQSVASGAVDAWELRQASADAIGTLMGRDECKNDAALRSWAGEFLAEQATKDKSGRVRATSIKALAKFKADQAGAVIAEALKTDSQSDELRQAALDGLVELDSPGALQSAMVMAMPGHDTRTRPTAVGAIGKLGHQDKDAALRTLVSLLADHELRTQRAAGQALVDLKDQRALAEFAKAKAAARSDELRQQIDEWTTQLKEKLEETKP
jgi:aminopeptidase N